MSDPVQGTALQLQSLVTEAGELRLSLEEVAVAQPGEDEVLVEMGGAPINPSDLALLLAGADLSTMEQGGTSDRPVLTARIPAGRMPSLAARVGQPQPVGNEGAGVVVKAGGSAQAQALLGKTVALVGGAMHSRYRCVNAAACLVLADGTTPAQGASAFVNPLTALGMVATLRSEGHKALVHTAAASNLGQMLNRICLADGVDLVNIVRSDEQAAILRAIGARHICNSSAAGFTDDLIQALAETGATLAFDAIGGGTMAGQILAAMEVAANRNTTDYNRYGSTIHKQVYVYGMLDPRPIELGRNIGMAWGVGGWLLTPFLQKIGAPAASEMRARVAREITTTFASHYTQEISLAEALQPAIVAAYARQATGEKYLINPGK